MTAPGTSGEPAARTWSGRADHWEPSRAASRDPDLRNADNFDELVRNTYKVLLTRGLLGCIVYSVDEETQHMLAGLGMPELQGSHL